MYFLICTFIRTCTYILVFLLLDLEHTKKERSKLPFKSPTAGKEGTWCASGRHIHTYAYMCIQCMHRHIITYKHHNWCRVRILQYFWTIYVHIWYPISYTHIYWRSDSRMSKYISVISVNLIMVTARTLMAAYGWAWACLNTAYVRLQTQTRTPECDCQSGHKDINLSSYHVQ